MVRPKRSISVPAAAVMSGNPLPLIAAPVVVRRSQRLVNRQKRRERLARNIVVVAEKRRKRKPRKKCEGNYWVDGYERKCPSCKEKAGGCRMGRRGGGLLSYLKDPLNWVDPLGVRHILGFGMNSIVFFLFLLCIGSGIGQILAGLGTGVGLGVNNLLTGLLGSGRSRPRHRRGGMLWGGRVLPTTMPVKWRNKFALASPFHMNYQAPLPA